MLGRNLSKLFTEARQGHETSVKELTKSKVIILSSKHISAHRAAPEGEHTPVCVAIMPAPC